MIVFATEFPIARGTDPDAVLQTAEQWLLGSPKMPWNGVVLDAVPDGETMVTDHAGQRLQRTRLRTPSVQWAGLRHEWLENGEREWITEIVAWASEELVMIGIRLECNLLAPGSELPTPNKPHFLKMLFRQFAGGRDSWLTVGDQPAHLTESQVPEAASIVEGTTDALLPIVYLSAGSGHRPSVDPVRLSRALAGLAHVIVEPSRHFSFALAQNVRWQNPYGGAVGLFWPRSSDHVRLFRREFPSSGALMDKVVELVRQSLVTVRPTADLTWGGLQERIVGRRIETLRAEGSTQVDEWIAVFEADRHLKDAHIDELNRTLARKDAEVRQLKAQIQVSNGFLQDGVEQEYYPGEIRDAVIYALKLGAEQMKNDGRRQHIIRGILQANVPSSTEEEITEALRNAIGQTGNMSASAKRALENLGFTVAGGAHPKAQYRDDPRYAFTFASTAGDHRAGRNMLSLITRTLFK